MSRVKLLVPAVVLVLADPSAADEVDDFLTEQMAKRYIPGLVLAVVRDGEVVKSKAYGLADVELKVPASLDSVFEIGSITKPFTAMAVLLLVESEKIGLDDPITRHLADLPDAWKDVTVRHLLNHTSGIKSYTGVTDFNRLARNDHTPEEILKLVRDRPLEFAPGESWAYNNTGYYLLGLLVEKVSGQRFGDFLVERVVRPLGMSETRPNNPRAIIPNRASGYGELLGVLANRDPITPTSAFAAGFLVSTVGDLVRWDAALREQKLLKDPSYRSMYEPAMLKDGTPRPYGFGWGVRSTLGHKVLSHAGGTAGFSTIIARYVDDDLTVIILCNLAGADTNALALGVARHYVPTLSPRAAMGEADPDPKRTERLRTAFEGMLADQLDESAFTPSFAKFLQTGPAKSTSRSLAGRGPLRSFAFLKGKADGPLYYRAELGKTSHLLTFQLTPEGKIAGLLIENAE